MADKTFTPGQRVRIIDYPDEGAIGMTGTVRKKSVLNAWYIVDSDEALPQEMWGHDDQPEHDLFVYPYEMEAI